MPGCQACQGLRAPRGLREVSATQEAQACLGRRVTRVFQDWTASLGSKEKQVSLGHQASVAQPARRASPAVMASRGQQGRRAIQVHQDEASQEPQGPKEKRVQRVKWVSPVCLGVLEFQDPKANKASWVHRDPRDSLAYLVLLAEP